MTGAVTSTKARFKCDHPTQFRPHKPDLFTCPTVGSPPRTRGRATWKESVAGLPLNKGLPTGKPPQSGVWCGSAISGGNHCRIASGRGGCRRSRQGIEEVGDTPR